MAARILFALPGLHGGGAERVVVTVLRHLDRARFEPHLLVGGAVGPYLGGRPAGRGRRAARRCGRPGRAAEGLRSPPRGLRPRTGRGRDADGPRRGAGPRGTRPSRPRSRHRAGGSLRRLSVEPISILRRGRRVRALLALRGAAERRPRGAGGGLPRGRLRVLGRRARAGARRRERPPRPARGSRRARRRARPAPPLAGGARPPPRPDRPDVGTVRRPHGGARVGKDVRRCTRRVTLARSGTTRPTRSPSSAAPAAAALSTSRRTPSRAPPARRSTRATA